MMDTESWRQFSAEELERGYNARATVPDVDALLREEIQEDADWAEVVDQLDVLLRKGREG